ncbi:MAG TPA: glycosyltransferase, partial [Candidatus Krumholzibacteria bacterium]|nr:glycosyltransferase [Candidatus Krumholzibacteria bacterium]
WFAEIKWDYLRTRKQQLIRRRPDGSSILFFEPFVRGRDNHYDMRETDGIRVVTVPFIKNIPAGAARSALNVPLARHIVDASARARVRGHLRRAGIDPARSVFIISNVFAINVALGFAPLHLVYDCNDAHADFPGFPAWSRSHQEKTLRCADRVIVSGQRLRDDAVLVRGSENNIFDVGNGVDYAMFHRALAMRTKPGAARPRIGYLGAIAPWFDFDLVTAAATARPQWDFVLVGPVLAGAGAGLARLSSLANVSVQPAVAHDEVPRVLAGFDVGLIPFRLTTLTAGVNPNKLYEYLAAGLPVVSTPFSPDVEADADVIALAADAAGFVNACERFLARQREEGGSARMESRAGEIASAHDWDRIAKEFWARACG